MDRLPPNAAAVKPAAVVCTWPYPHCPCSDCRAAACAAAPRLAVAAELLTACRVQSRGTTARPPALFGNPEWSADVEHVWGVRMAPAVARWEKRRREARRRGDDARAEYAASRGAAIAMARGDIVGACRGRWRTVGCGCGRREIPVGCDQPALCEWCRRRHWRRWRHRITRALRMHTRAAIGAWAAQGARTARPGIYLVTLTGPHSGDLVVDRTELGKAVRRLLKHATAAGWWKHYALVWECAPRPGGKGHVHAHLAVVASWIPYKELHAAWRAAMPGALVLDVQSPRGASRKQPGNAANYLSKYVTKGTEPTDMSGQTAGEWLVAQHHRRRVTTSRGFWWREEPFCPTCRRKCYLHSPPIGLRERVPAGVLRSQARRLAPRMRPPPDQIPLVKPPP